VKSSLRNFLAELLCHALTTPVKLGDLLWMVGFCTIADREHSPMVPVDFLEPELSRLEEEGRSCGLNLPARSFPKFLQLVYEGKPVSSERWSEGQRDRGAFMIRWNADTSLPVHSLRLLSDTYWSIVLELKPNETIVFGDLERLLKIGGGLFNRGLFFEFHELLEEPWFRARGLQKQFLQGIIQIAVGFYRLQARKLRGCLQLLREGEEKMAPLAPVFLGLDVREFLDGIAACRAMIARLGEQAPDQFDWASIPLMRSVPDTRGIDPRD